jgi:hypothetical protein
MRLVICWLFGHDRLASKAAHGVCLRCGRRAARRDTGLRAGRKEAAAAAGSR